jgi:hypothetical protein
MGALRSIGALVAAGMAVAYMACGERTVDPPEDEGPEGPTEWQRTLPATDALGSVRGLRPVRGIVHLHSPFSHDACDGDGYLGEGAIDEDCLVDLRRAACETRQDFLMITDHPAHMSFQDFEELLLVRGEDDALIRDGDGNPVAASWSCDDGRRILVQIGFESALMPVGMQRHVSGTVDARHAIYRGRDDASVAALRAEAEAFVIIPHTESWTVEELRAIAPDGVELYNLHANVDPNIRAERLGLPGFDAIAGLAPFLFEPETAPEPDLAALAFLDLMDPHLERWHAVSLDRPTLGVAGSDAHQNILADPMGDGERGDSYRRLMRWFNNYFLLPEDAPITPATLRTAMEARRAYVAFDVLCTPAGVDLRLEDEGGAVVAGIGEVASLQGSLSIRAPAPTCHGGWAQAGFAPELKMRLVRVQGTGEAPVVEVIAEGDGDLAAEVPGPGMYYLRVALTPTHFESWLGVDPDAYLRAFPWVVTNAIHVEP